MLTPHDILYKDQDIMVINKPAGLLSQKSLDPTRKYVLLELKLLLQEHFPDESDYVALHHRLDKDTSGVMVLARSKRANKPLMNMFKQRLASKTYLALTAPCSPLPSFPCTVENHLATQKKQKGQQGPQPQIAVHSGGDYALSSVDLLAQQKKLCLLQVEPKTGRRHQIRTHLASIRLPILGDPLYGGQARYYHQDISRVMLHAYQLSFPHPITEEQVTFTAPIPEDFHALATHFELTIPEEV